ALVALENRPKIEKYNVRIKFTKPQREETYQVTLDALKLSSCYPALLITAEEFDAYKTYLAYATGATSPKMERKLKKPTSPSKKRTLVTVEEEESRPVKKVIPTKKPATKRQKSETTIHQVGGSSEGVDSKSEVPYEPKGKSIDTNAEPDDEDKGDKEMTNAEIEDVEHENVIQESGCNQVKDDAQATQKTKATTISSLMSSLFPHLKQTTPNLTPTTAEATTSTTAVLDSETLIALHQRIGDLENDVKEPKDKRTKDREIGSQTRLNGHLKPTLNLHGKLHGNLQSQLKRKKLTNHRNEQKTEKLGARLGGVDSKSEVPYEPKGKSIDTSKGTGLKSGVPDVSKCDFFKNAEPDDKDTGDKEMTNAEIEDVEHENVIQESACNQVKDDAQATQKTKVPRISPLLTILVSVFPKHNVINRPDTITITSATTISSLMSSLFPHLKQTTPILTPTTAEATTSTTAVPDSETLIALHQRIGDLENDVKEPKDVDNSSKVISTIQYKVPKFVKEYLESSLDDAMHKIEHARKQKVPKDTITSSDTIALTEFDRKTTLFETMTKSKSFKKSLKKRGLYHALIELILMDEDVMNEGVADKLKKRKPGDADKDEGPFAGSDRGLKRQKTSKDTKQSKKATAEATTSTTAVLDSETLIALHQRIGDLENDVKEPKDVDNSSKVISTIQYKVLKFVKEYLESSLDDAMHKVIKKNVADIIKEHSVSAETVERLMRQYAP
nr:hypothetical protein [Tanacetum cinerariifolium]